MSNAVYRLFKKSFKEFSKKVRFSWEKLNICPKNCNISLLRGWIWQKNEYFWGGKNGGKTDRMGVQLMSFGRV